MSCSSEADPSENVSPQLDALVAMALVLLLGEGTAWDTSLHASRGG